MRRRRFLELVWRALEGLPPQIREALHNLDIAVQNWPTKHQLAEAGAASPYGLLGLYEGIPLTQRHGGDPLLPDRITLFQRPVEAVCSSEEEVLRQVKVTVLHEVGHYLGLGEEELEGLGYG